MRPYYSQPGMFLLPLVVALGATGSVRACPGDEVQVTVVSILAKKDANDNVPEKLAELAKRIKERRPDLNSFRIDTQCCEKIAVDQPKEFKFVENKKAVVTVRQAADANNQVKLKVELPCVGKVCYTTCCGKFFPMMTCHKTEKGEWLIVAVMVKPCKGK